MNVRLLAIVAALPFTLALSACSGGKPGPTVTVTKTVTAPVPSDDSGVESINNDGNAGEYACKQGYESLQIPVGKTVQRDGSTVSLSEKRPAEFLADQQSVQLSIKLSATDSVPSVIINTGAHKKRPDLWPQSTLKLDLKKGGSGTYTLLSSAYAENYTVDGITDITLCIHR